MELLISFFFFSLREVRVRNGLKNDVEVAVRIVLGLGLNPVDWL